MKVEDKNLAFLFLRVLVSDDFGQVNNNQKKMDYMADEISNSLRKEIDDSTYEMLQKISLGKDSIGLSATLTGLIRDSYDKKK